jgi:hypothetical protein
MEQKDKHAENPLVAQVIIKTIEHVKGQEFFNEQIISGLEKLAATGSLTDSAQIKATIMLDQGGQDENS